MNPDDCALYARFSTDRQDARSIDDQFRRCRAFAAPRGWRIVGEYKDAAVSGTHIDRQDLQRLLLDAHRGAFKHILLDDVSRLSRDLGDVWNLVFKEFAVMGVHVVDCTTGISSDHPSARMVFGTMGLVSDIFIQMIRAETHRGLEGRALKGFATGGRTYGFATIAEENPPDPEHPRKRRVIHPGEAEVIRRIFASFAEGGSFKGIAATLNEDRIAAPHDGGKGNKKARGWGHSTIRHMLRNENYIGVFVWNKFQWKQIPGASGYKPLARPENEHVRTEIPELRIIPEDVWAQVQSKFRRRATGKSRPAGTGKFEGSLLSGLLRCGICAASFVVVSRRHKNGVGYANFGCSGNRSRGSAICNNHRTVSERKLAEAVTGAIKTQLTQPECLDRFVAAFNERFNELQGGDDGGVKALERQLSKAETRLKNLMDAFAKIGFSEALSNQLKVEEESVAALKAKLAAATRARRPKVLPHPKVIRSYIENLLAVLETDKVRARELLARHMPPLVLTPDADGYRVSGGFNLAVMLDEVAAAPGVTAEKSMISEVGGTDSVGYRTEATKTFRLFLAVG